MMRSMMGGSHLRGALMLLMPLLSLAAKYPYEPIYDIDLHAYTGRWYQTYASASAIYLKQFGGNCVTVDYHETKKDRTIAVANTARPFAGTGGYGSETGFLSTCLGLTSWGYLTLDPYVDGQGYLEKQAVPIPFGIGAPDINDVRYQEPGNYWVIELGPIVDGQYQYSVVTDSLQTKLYILVRDVDEWEALYEKQVLKKLYSFDFTSPTNKPVKTNQVDCGYKEHKTKDDEYESSYEDDYYYDDGDDW